MFLPTNIIWDVGQTRDIDASDSMKELLVRMYQNLGNMANVINLKESAIYDTNEFVCGKVYFPNQGLTSQSSQVSKLRQSMRSVAIFPSLPGVGLNFLPHKIPFNAASTMTVISAAATDSTNLQFYPLPYVAVPPDNNISLWLDGTNINIHNNGTDRTTCSAIIVFEYLKF
jgi:hypothetical protein